mmetsp:Transcript_6297/g.19068  ORF Transcript_6297/g.19068 Transcript_6297/m.19068 type:complete len:263 (+) Transcript_6297:1009-1797(+)
MQNWMRPIFAFSTLLGPPLEVQGFWFKRRPLSSMMLSSMVPPPFLMIDMSLRSTLFGFSGLITFRTVSTAMGASKEACCDTTLLLSEVVAALIRASLSWMLIGAAISCKISAAFLHAFPIESEMIVGWTPLLSSSRHFFSREPQITTTEVVPSPAFTSCDFESSTSIFAAGCKTFTLSRMVAPSLVMITSPSACLTILSMPLGPRDVLTASESALAASMFEILTSTFLESSRKVSPFLPPPAFGATMVSACSRLLEWPLRLL